MKVRIQCRTNLDGFTGAAWPNYTAIPPKVGERVMARCGAMLAIVSISHAEFQNGEPYLALELHRWTGQ